MSKQWEIGAWAEAAEREEAEEKERRAAAATAASARGKHRKKTQSLYQFFSATGPGSIFSAPGLTPAEMIVLPKGPHVRSAEEEAHERGPGGAFRDYAPDRYGRGFGYECKREAVRHRAREKPFRGDENESWSVSKREVSSGALYASGRLSAGERKGLRTMDHQDILPSRPDKADSRGPTKKPLEPVDVQDRRQRLSRMEASIEINRSRADEVDNWSRRKTVAAPLTSAQQSGTNASQLGEREYEPQHISSASATGSVNYGVPPSQSVKPKPNPFGSARPREVVLLESGVDMLSIDSGVTHKEVDSRPSSSNSRPPSSHSSRPVSSGSTTEPVSQPRAKVNPFGGAKPREVVLEEKGKDWRKMDFELEHRGVDKFVYAKIRSHRPETQDELQMKKEINVLKIEASMVGINEHDSGRRQHILVEIQARERQLEQLVRILDDRVRFSQKIGERPRSESGRSDISSRTDSRPGSWTGRSDTGWSIDRPPTQPQLLQHHGCTTMDNSQWSHSGWSGEHEVIEGVGSWHRFREHGKSFNFLRQPHGYVPSLDRGEAPDIWTRP